MALFSNWISLHPHHVIISCLLATALSATGLLKLRCFVGPAPMSCVRQEHKANLLWIPLNSPYNTHQVGHVSSTPTPQAWVEENFQKHDRPQIVTYQSDNVLTPQSLIEVFITSDDSFSDADYDYFSDAKAP